MGKFKLFSVLRHALTMVRRTLKSYALLSVTIVLSFSLLLGYLLYTDASLYNKYKELFAVRRGDVIIGDNVLYADSTLHKEKLNLLLQKLDSIGDTDYYIAYSCHLGHDTTKFDGTAIGLDEGETIEMLNIYALLLPDYVWLDGLEMMLEDLYGTSASIVWLDGMEHADFILGADEVILSEKVYLALGMDQVDKPVYTLQSSAGPSVTLNVVGYAKSPTAIDYSKNSWISTPPMFLSTKFIDAVDLQNPNVWDPPFGEGTNIIETRYIAVHSGNPEEVVNLAKEMKYTSYYSAYERQNAALEKIRTEKGTKAVIACALLLLLGINLYSSFTNALNDRKFEIGVKRAIGASSWSIVRQFLYESLIVMSANILISIALVADISVVYKYIYERTPDAYGNLNQWVIYISSHSAAMFAVCAVTLTIVFSLVFAYKSTRVEIVQYLKAE